MFSLQRLLGKEDKFFTLLEASAEEARSSVQTLVKLSKSLDQPAAKDEFAYVRRKDKQITQEISAAVYSKQWTNPRPDVEIQSIDMLYGPDKRGVPALLGISTG